MRLVLATLCATGCIRNTVESFTYTVIDRAMTAPDVDRVCQIGAALGSPLAATTSPKRAPLTALIITEATAGLCDEARAREAELSGLVAASSLTGAGRIAAIKDAREQERRARQRAALRLYKGWQHAEAKWGPLGETCPSLKQKDEVAFVVGLVSGTLAMLHDKTSGAHNAVPLDTLSKAGRAARCLDDTKWWGFPEALEAAAWLTVPGSGPEGVEPWEQIEAAAVRGEGTGVRLGWALAVMMASNTGDERRLEQFIPAAAAAFDSEPTHPEWQMFDAYAREVVLHESDLIWAAEAGHRTLEFGELPVEELPTPAPTEDPFAEDPFAEAPFAEGTLADPIGDPIPSKEEVSP